MTATCLSAWSLWRGKKENKKACRTMSRSAVAARTCRNTRLRRFSSVYGRAIFKGPTLRLTGMAKVTLMTDRKLADEDAARAELPRITRELCDGAELGPIQSVLREALEKLHELMQYRPRLLER